MGQIIRVFPHRTAQTPIDPLSFVGDPPLFRPPADEVHISCVFTWDKPEAERLRAAWAEHYRVVRVGGPAYDDPGCDFVPGRYITPGVTFTTRGCPNACPWCFVPKREGNLRCLPIQPGWIVQDNNLTAAPWSHIEAVFQMLRQQPHPINLAGGLEADRINDRWLSLLKSVHLGQVFIAYDAPGRAGDAQRAIERLRAAGLSRRRVRCFVLMGRKGDTIEDADSRCQQVLDWGADPFAMLYRDETGGRPGSEWRNLQRFWSRPAAYRKRQPPTNPTKP